MLTVGLGACDTFGNSRDDYLLAALKFARKLIKINVLRLYAGDEIFTDVMFCFINFLVNQ